MKYVLLAILVVLSSVVIPAVAFGEVVDLIQLGDTTHAYTGGNGPNSIDGDWATSQSASYNGTDGGGSCSVTSEHIFSQVNDIIRLKYRFVVHAFSQEESNYGAGRSYTVYIQTRSTDGNWGTIAETHQSGSAGGTGSIGYDSGELELAVNIDDVTGIRAYAFASSHAAGGGGRFDGYARIYEVQAFGGPNIVMPPSTAYADLIQLADTVHTYNTGNGPNSIDGDWATSQSASYNGTNGGGSCSVTSEHTFSQACDVIMIKYRFLVHAFSQEESNYGAGRSYAVYIETRSTDGNWGTIAETYRSGSAGGSGSIDYDSGELELAVNIDDVTGIRAYAFASSHAAGGGGRFDGYARIYEVQAFGKYYKDIGIRIKHNTEIIKIGAEDLNDNTHKLRIRKGDTTYGIPLLERDHDDASPILIYDGNQIKALAEIKQWGE